MTDLDHVANQNYSVKVTDRSHRVIAFRDPHAVLEYK